MLVACAGGASDTGNDPTFVGTSTTMAMTMTSTTVDPSTTVPDDDDADASADGTSSESSESGTMPDVPAECMPGALDCPCDEGSCVDPLLCIADLCEEPADCEADPNEPNDDVDSATPLGDLTDDDATLEFIGVLDTPDDVDWLTYAGTDILGETVDPARTVQLFGGTLEICKFLVCNAGTPLIACPPGTTAATSGFMDGCCGSGSFAFDADGFECQAGAFDTSATVYLRLSGADLQCVGYSGTVHF